MKFYFINTNAARRYGETYKIWLERRCAFISGRPPYNTVLERLRRGDICFMYVNKKGVKTFGKVIEEWDRINHAKPIIPGPPGKSEFRIPMNWHPVSPDKFVSPSELREIIGYTPLKACQHISNRDGAEKLLQHMLQMPE